MTYVRILLSWLGWPFRTLWRWWRPPQRRHEFSGVVFVDSAEDPAREIRRHRLVLIGTAEKPKWLRFACPCSCGDVLALNLMRSRSPHWTVQQHDDGTLTVHPSVDSTTCGAHFWIRRNRIQWV